MKMARCMEVITNVELYLTAMQEEDGETVSNADASKGTRNGDEADANHGMAAAAGAEGEGEVGEGEDEDADEDLAGAEESAGMSNHQVRTSGRWLHYRYAQHLWTIIPLWCCK